MVLRAVVGPGELEDGNPGGGCFSRRGGAVLAMGVGVGVACADEAVEIAGEG